MRIKNILKLIGLSILATSSRLLEQIANSYYPEHYQPCNDYQLAYGNPTTKTTIWLLGETHDRRDESLRCMEQLTANMGQHIIYLEDETAPWHFPCSMKKIANRWDRTCAGWDDEIAMLHVWNYFYGNCNIKPLLLNQKIHGFSDVKYDQYLTYFLSRMSVPYTKQCAMLFLLREQEISYKDIQFILPNLLPAENKTSQTINESIEASQRQSNIERNKSLLRVAKQGGQGFFKIVIAGVSHLQANSEIDKHFSVPDGAGADYIEEQLRQLPDQNSYAVLVPKRKWF